MQAVHILAADVLKFARPQQGDKGLQNGPESLKQEASMTTSLLHLITRSAYKLLHAQKPKAALTWWV